ncbi:MAG: hypothetical protein COA58_12100 [Bacteroidetes bacterium]|nr:MAG: hypothetical protein COA58_12100 [Bacteroidota bacterium]
MELAFIPRFLIGLLSSKFQTQRDLNILLSNTLVILFFKLFQKGILNFSESIPHFCLFKKIFGAGCPVCGITRGLNEVASGNWQNAMTLNSSAIPITLFFLLQIPLRIVSLSIEGSSSAMDRLSGWLNKILITYLLLTWITQLIIK